MNHRLLITLALLSPLAALAAPARPPNLIWIMADDLGYGDLGSYGQKVISTPHLDRMAQEGLRFTQFYAGATVCAPSRSVLMTGRHHGRTRVRGNAGTVNPAAQALREGDTTVAGALQAAGYATALIGKWGLGDVGAAAGGLPRRHGFGYFFGFLNQTHAHNHFPDFLWRNEDRISLPNKVTPVGSVPGAGYATDAVLFADDLFTDEALKFVSNHQQRPFFLYWSMIIPHANNERTRELKNGAHVPDFGPYAGKDWPEPDKGQAAMITRMDSYVGRMLAQLRQLGLAENTLVIFTSDNGPHNESNHDLSRFEPSGALNGIKRSLTDGGIRVPALAWWPGTVKPGSVIGAPVSSPDFFPTLLEAAGAKPAPGQILDGVSLVPVLRGGAAPERAIFWQYPHYGNQGGAPAAAVRRGPWKLIHWFEDDRFELFNVVADLGEATDLAAREPARVVALRTELAAWQRTVGAKFPTANPTYDDTKPNGRASIRPGSPEANTQKAKSKK